ncbi:MAG: hypothetical protein WDM77_12675 [Steroidobacteraceae bacterium]
MRIASVDLPPEGGPSSSSRRPADIRACGGGLEVIDDPRQGFIDAEQFAAEQRAVP